jgi:5S rRNA maturation endonuclease (ribonuclease M5)
MDDPKEELMRLLDELRDGGKIVIVEGVKDKRALAHFGITNVITLSRKALFEVIEEVANATKECVLLTDLDRKGKELFGTLNQGLQHHGVRVDNELREFLFKKTTLSHIEGLVTYVT